SSGMLEVQSKTFDRISFKWNGKAGAKLMVRFNCLSTDFSRIKGVKGIPLRVHMDTFLEGAGGNSNGGGGGGDLDSSSGMERSFAKIKLFRDKGAERKNKDDHKHLEKMWDKMRGKNADTNPLVNMLAPVQSVSLFSECMDHPEGSGEDETLDLSETNNNNNSSNQRGLYVDPTQSQVGFASSAAASALSSSSTSSTSLTAALVSSSEMFLDRDPNYVAPARKKRPVLCLYIKIGGESVYRAVYLEKYTLADLTQKLSEKLEIQSSTISSVYRKTTTKKELVVRVDDAMVAQMTDELDMVVEYEFNQQDGNVDLTLKY
ncbi:CP2 transcription factor-domain-containing protein, partial [Dissophora ornata]